MDPEIREWADRFAIVGVEWLHEINRHIFHEGNKPTGEEMWSWLAMEVCNHTDCRNGRKFRRALEAEKAKIPVERECGS